MKKILLLLIILFGYSVSLLAQINFDIRNKKISFFKELEIKNKSELVKSGSNYINENNVDQPLIYKRKQNALPDLLVYYFPIKKDSTVSYILYEWQDKQPQVKSWDETKPYIEKYSELLNLITSTYGKSQSDGDLADTALIEKNGLTRTDEWKNDTTDIEMYITVSNKHLMQRNITINPTRTIRLYVRNHGESTVAPSLSKVKINALDLKAKLFIEDLCAGKFDDSRQYIAAYINPQIKNQQLDALKKALKDDKWGLDMSGMQLTTMGKVYANLRYSRLGDTNKPPVEILSILFDENDKIIAAQPLNTIVGQ